ncbi:MAG: hypothetical protein KAI47_28105, partial [Deltaproteobacteria bacterium]|nr:hypothetical protein [Deltaproteobacteria bacterium]
SRAIVRVDEALKKDPLNAEAQRYRKNALDELTNQKIFEEAGKFFALGNRENLQHALKIFRKVPKKSIYSRDTRYKIRTIRQRMAEGYRIEGMSRCKAHYRKRCYELLCKFFHEMPSSVQVAGEPGLRRRMVAIERRYRRQKSFTKCDAPRYLRTPGKAGSASLDQLLAEKYQDIRLRKVVAVYVGGKIDMALKIAAKYKTKRYMRPHLRQLAEITGRMLTIRGKYQEGYSFLRQRKVKEADENFGVLLDADAALVPKKIESFYRKEVKTDLSALYVGLGREDFKVKHYRDAFRFWKRGSEIDKTNAAILNGLLRLEKVAEILLREGRAASDQGHIPQARKKLTEARDIVRAGQAIRKQTDKALAALGK